LTIELGCLSRKAGEKWAPGRKKVEASSAGDGLGLVPRLNGGQTDIILRKKLSDLLLS